MLIVHSTEGKPVWQLHTPLCGSPYGNGTPLRESPCCSGIRAAPQWRVTITIRATAAGSVDSVANATGAGSVDSVAIATGAGSVDSVANVTSAGRIARAGHIAVSYTHLTLPTKA